PDVKETLKKYTVYPLKTVEELEDLYSNTPLNLLIIDTVSHRLSSLEELLNRLDDDMVVLITPEKLDKFTIDNFPPSVYECIDVESIKDELPVIVERALERQRFKNELRLLKQTREVPKFLQAASTSLKWDLEQYPGGRYLQKKVLVNFAKMLTASFDMRKLFNHFMDSVAEIVRVSKMSIMLRDKEGFHIKTHWGLDPYIADNLRLKKDSALIAWLSKTGRIMHKPVNPADTASINIKAEMELLQCTYSFPMIHKGKLIGIFNIDNKITEEPFYKEELEIIYLLCNYLAAAVKDIDLYHQIWYQKEFAKNIISSINSGMIAIDRDEKITVFNQQASEILDLDSSEMFGNDLRILPSPLGDILYETMMTGTAYKRYEVEIRPKGVSIGINSYRLLDEQQNPTGAGIVFSDLSDSKKLEEHRRRTEKLQAVNDLMAKIAHEVRNPLTAIQTYIQLMHEKCSDDEMRSFFISSVSQSIYTLDNLIDKLVTFSDTLDYNFNREDVNLIIDEAADHVSKNIPETHKFSRLGIDSESFFINADKKLLIKAIYYLILHIVDRTPQGTLITMSAKTIIKDPPCVEISIKYDGDEFTDEEKQSLLKPLLDIDNLGTELNVPISHKIIEKHNGSLDIKSDGGSNTFIIKLPLIDRRSPAISIDKGH
ncbi:MAG: histidine kinase dimerization/phospho-acceptor domain-containing protein, partial [Nitrospirota bacterium]